MFAELHARIERLEKLVERLIEHKSADHCGVSVGASARGSHAHIVYDEFAAWVKRHVPNG